MADTDWGKLIGGVLGTGIGAFGGPITAGVGGMIGTGIGGMFDPSQAGGEGGYPFIEPSWYQNPEYPEAEQARGEWGSRLQEWGQQPGYGAIAPDWGDIWNRARQRVSQYYWGGPGGQQGLSGKVKASAARRNVAESPAMETQLGRMGMQEAGQLKDIASEQSVQEAQFGETGRQNWMTWLQNLAQQKPSGVWSTGRGGMGGQMGAPAAGIGGAITDLISSGVGLFQDKEQQSWLEDLIKQYSGGGTSQTSIIGGGQPGGRGGFTTGNIKGMTYQPQSY